MPKVAMMVNGRSVSGEVEGRTCGGGYGAGYGTHAGARGVI